MVRESFEERLNDFRARVETALGALVPEAGEQPETLHSAMRHSLEAGGKRLRPVLVCATAECFGGPADPLPAAAAIECLHTYTLIHDDLPAMDDSDLRRGRPTCHRVYGEAAAVLAGDALLTLAFGIIARSYPGDPDLAVRIAAELAEASGSRWLVGGQMEDLENEGAGIDAATLSAINEKKTGALIAAACVMGARIGGAAEGQVGVVRDFGFALGGAFQVIDDILDSTAPADQTGKPGGLDEENGKTTFVSLEGLEKARDRADGLTRRAAGLLRDVEGDTSFLSDLLDWLNRRKA
ncbi:MAG: polyprenyl synthetase family protein [Puniceicoccaceae bacterium]